MAINLGYVPQRLTVTLAEGGDFVSALVSSVAWPVGTGIKLELSGGTEAMVTWDATVSGTRADWDVDNTEVQDVITGKYSTARLIYTEADGTVLVWGEGSVRVT